MCPKLSFVPEARPRVYDGAMRRDTSDNKSPKENLVWFIKYTPSPSGISDAPTLENRKISLKSCVYVRVAKQWRFERP